MDLVASTPNRTHLRRVVGAVAFTVCGLLVSACASAPVADIAATPAPAEFDAAQQQDLLARHNVYRAEVGEAPLVWDAAIAAGAQQWADAKQADGMFEHSSWDSRPGLGENLAGGPIDGATDRLAADERVAYQTNPEKVGEPPGNWMQWGHYSQIVWSSTTRVGCGFAPRGNLPYDLVVCRYAGPGNFSGEYPYPPDTVLVPQPGLTPVARAGASTAPAAPATQGTGQAPNATAPDAGQAGTGDTGQQAGTQMVPPEMATGGTTEGTQGGTQTDNQGDTQEDTQNDTQNDTQGGTQDGTGQNGETTGG